VSAQNPTASFAEMAAILDRQWKSLSAAERRKWEQVSEIDSSLINSLYRHRATDWWDVLCDLPTACFARLFVAH
jgi:hypothetical protein